MLISSSATSVEAKATEDMLLDLLAEKKAALHINTLKIQNNEERKT